MPWAWSSKTSRAASPPGASNAEPARIRSCSRELNVDLLYGRNSVLEALRAGRTVRRLLIADGAHGLDNLVAEVRQTYDGPLEVGEDLMSFEIGDTVTMKRLMPKALS